MAGFGGYLEAGGGGGGTFSTAGQLVETTLKTAEAISGGRCVSITTSGTLQIAMCLQSGRMPAIGYVRDNYTSGAVASVYTAGRLFNAVSGTPFDFSGLVGYPVFVGESGHAIASGMPLVSGAIIQVVGVSIFQSGIFLQVNNAFEKAFIVSGDLGSGVVTTYDFGSGSIAPNSFGSLVFMSGMYASGSTVTNVKTEETISGIRAVHLTLSGTLRVAMASVSGRMPAIGIAVDNALSGIELNVYTKGMFPVSISGLYTFGSGQNGRLLWVGQSGQLGTVSGGWCSGGWGSGNVGQNVGTIFNSGVYLIDVSRELMSGGPNLTYLTY